MENKLCDWCEKRNGSNYNKTVGRDNFVSSEKFCSLRCKSQYEDKYNIRWIKKSDNTLLWIIIVIELLVAASQS
jgi:hypothetical protein